MTVDRSGVARLIFVLLATSSRADDPPAPSWDASRRAVEDALSAGDAPELERTLVALDRFPGERSVATILESLPRGEALGIYGEDHGDAIREALLEAAEGDPSGLAELVARAGRDLDRRIRLVAIDAVALRPDRGLPGRRAPRRGAIERAAARVRLAPLPDVGLGRPSGGAAIVANLLIEVHRSGRR